jgi:hypothetical protein
MNSFFRAAAFLAAAATVFPACDAFQDPVERVCPALPRVEFTPDSSVGYGVKDNLLVSIKPYGVEDSEKFTCPATVCFTLDGSEPDQNRASTQCLAAPVKQIPIKRSTCIKYFVIGSNGTQSVTRQECYRVEPPPVSYCDPQGKSSREPITVSLISSKAGTIFYTLDGSDPDPYGESSETLSGEAPQVDVMLDVEGSTTIKFRAQDKDGNVEERVNTCEYKFDPTPPTTLVTPSGSPTEHSASGEVTVNLEADELASIYYTLDGSTPSPTRLNESGLGSTFMEFSSASLKLTKSAVLVLYSVDLVGNEESPYQKHVYLIDGVPAIALSSGAGTYPETEISITIETYPASTQVRYTVDGATEPTCGVSGAGRTYATPITDFDRPGDFTLKYRACYGASNAGPVMTAEYTLGASGRPYPVLIDFNDVSQYDAVGSSKTVEHNTHKGYARLRPKIPTQIGAGYDGVNTNNYLDQPQEVAISNSYLFYAAGNALRVYNLGSFSPAGSNSFPVDAPGFTTPYCSTTNMNGLLLGLNVFPDGGGVSAITPWTDRGIFNFGTGQVNCGGFARWNMNLSGASTRNYIKGNVSQFAGPPDDPFLTDLEEIAPGTQPNLPKTDSEVGLNATHGEYIAYLPHYRGGAYRVDGFFALTGNQAITSPTATSGRPLALQLNVTGTFLAVGDSQGELYTLNTDDLSLVSQASVVCPAGSDCRINGLTWHTSDSFVTYLIAAVGYYGDERGGQIAVAEVSPTGGLTLVSSTAYPDSDPFAISAPVEAIAVLPDGDHAVVALREQGLLVVDLATVASGSVASRGYVTGSDIGDNLFWATDVTPYPLVLGTNAVAVVDSGRSATTMDAGFRLFEFNNVDKIETSGYFQSSNLNASPDGIAIGRAKLVEVVSKTGNNPLSTTLPLGARVTFVVDEVYLNDPAAVGGTVTFPDPATDLRVRIEFASPDSGTTNIEIHSLKLELTPVE